MGKHQSWGESATGPDMLDIEMAMRAVQEVTPGVVSLTILPQGRGATGGLHIALAWTPSLEVVNGAAEVVLSESIWPCREGCTFLGHVLSGISKLDNKLWLLQARGELPKA